MRWLIFALASVAVAVVAVVVAGRMTDEPDGVVIAEEPDADEVASELDARLRRLGTRSSELASYFSETGIAEQLGIFDSRLRQIKVAIDRAREAASSEDPLVRDEAGRMLERQRLALEEQKRRFDLFDRLFTRMRPHYLNAFGRVSQVNTLLQGLIDRGVECREEQATAREIVATYRHGRRFLFAQLSRVLDGEDADETVLALAEKTLQRTYEELQPLYGRLQRIDIERARIEAQLRTIPERIAWARGVREKLGDDPWLEEPEADLAARTREWERLEKRARALLSDPLADGFVAEARALIDDMAALLKSVNVYVTKARSAGLPLPR